MSNLIEPGPNWRPREVFSPSQLSTYLRCPRAWGWRYLCGLKEAKKTNALAFGSLIHACLEAYLKGGTVYDLKIGGRLAKDLETLPADTRERLIQEAPKRAIAGLHLLPDLRECEQVLIEESLPVDSTLVCPDIEPLKFQMFLDLQFKRAGQWYLVDHKSTKGRTQSRGPDMPRDPWAYVKTEEELRRDPQGVLYPLAMMQAYQQPALWARWAYYLTDLSRAPNARALDVCFLSSHVAVEAALMFRHAGKMRRHIRKGTHPADMPIPDRLPPDPDSPCAAFGGCPYRAEVGGPCRTGPNLNLGALIVGTMTSNPLLDAVAAATTPQEPAPLPMQQPQAPQPPQPQPQPPLPPLPEGWDYDVNGVPRPIGDTAPAPTPEPTPEPEPEPKKKRGRPRKTQAAKEVEAKAEVEIIVRLPGGGAVCAPVTEPRTQKALIDFAQKYTTEKLG